MAQTNYFLGLQRGFDNNPDNVVSGTATAGTAVDIELNLQIVNSSTATGLTRKDVVAALIVFAEFINGNGAGGNGGNLPAL